MWRPDGRANAHAVGHRREDARWRGLTLAFTRARYAYGGTARARAVGRPSAWHVIEQQREPGRVARSGIGTADRLLRATNAHCATHPVRRLWRWQPVRRDGAAPADMTARA